MNIIKATKIMGKVCFSGNLNPNPDGCAAALREGGFKVVRMPERFQKLMDVEGDEFMEVSKVSTDMDATWNEISAIAERFGGTCDECGEISDDHTPFNLLHDHDQAAG
jgi:hypothetical protein